MIPFISSRSFKLKHQTFNLGKMESYHPRALKNLRLFYNMDEELRDLIRKEVTGLIREEIVRLFKDRDLQINCKLEYIPGEYRSYGCVRLPVKKLFIEVKYKERVIATQFYPIEWKIY